MNRKVLTLIRPCRIRSAWSRLTATRCAGGLLMFVTILFNAASASSQSAVYVKDFGAVPGDTTDDAVAIQAAFNYAKTHHIKRIEFSAGRYLLKVKAAPSMNAYFGITDFDGLQVAGVMHGDTPATWLVKYNPRQNNTILPSHARFDRCDHLSISGFVFDNTPQYATAGIVSGKGPGYIEVAVYDGLPAVNGMGCYTANIWDTATMTLKQVPSLTFADDVSREKLYWELTQRGGRNYMKMNSARFAAAVQPGDGISWHFGAPTMFQLAINYCNDLTLNNLLTVNIAGWGIQTYACTNINSRNVIFKANGNQLATGPRDAWKLNSCNGLVTIDSMHVEGVRWDGQNVHGSFLQVKTILGHDKIRVWKKYASVAAFVNDSIGFWDGDTETKRLAVSWQQEKQGDGGVYGVIETNDPLPSFVKSGTLVTVYAWDIDHYQLRHASFKNIAGCASVIKCTSATLDDVSYDHIMYPAILFGTEIVTHNEATFPQNVLVKNSRFSNSGWIARINTKALVGIGNSGTTAMAIGRIRFDSCSFDHAATGIDASGIKELIVTNSRFTAVTQPYTINKSNTGKVIFDNNIIVPSGTKKE